MGARPQDGEILEGVQGMTVTLEIPDDLFPSLRGQDAARFILQMVKEDPELALKAATEIELRGTFGRISEDL